jgi:hypothetical protein
MKVIYKDVEYFVISTSGELIEIAPTQHGAGSFTVHRDFIKFIKRSLAELDDVIDEIIERNPEWVEHIMKIVEKGQRK